MNLLRFQALAVVLGGVIFSFCRSAQAYRPFDGTDADVAETGEFELELGPLHYYQEAGRKYLLAPATVLNLGILPRFELVVDFKNVVPLSATSGPSFQVLDTDVFLKTILHKGVLQEEAGPSIAVEYGPLLPEFNGKRGMGAAANLIISEKLGPIVFHLNDQLSLTRGDHNVDWFASLITEYKVPGPVRPVAELSWERDFKETQNSYSLLGGLIWSLDKDLIFDAAGRVMRVGTQKAFESRFGLTWSIGVWEPHRIETRDPTEISQT